MALFQPARRGGSATGTSEIPAKQPTRRGASGYEAVRASRDFWTIRRRAHSFITPACVIFLSWYFLFVILAVFAPGFMRVNVFGDVNIGLFLGGTQFISTFTIAVCYRSWARRRLDPLSDRLRRRLEDGQR
jgi:uncharacterized membrane protein (DUF485 family)